MPHGGRLRSPDISAASSDSKVIVADRPIQRVRRWRRLDEECGEAATFGRVTRRTTLWQWPIHPNPVLDPAPADTGMVTGSQRCAGAGCGEDVARFPAINKTQGLVLGFCVVA